MKTSRPVSSPLPLTEPTFYILLSLTAGKRHGYGILKDVELLSQGTVTLSVSTLYNALGRLLDQGLIERVPNEDEYNGKRIRKAYILTTNGRQVLEEETRRVKIRATAAVSALQSPTL